MRRNEVNQPAVTNNMCINCECESETEIVSMVSESTIRMMQVENICFYENILLLPRSLCDYTRIIVETLKLNSANKHGSNGNLSGEIEVSACRRLTWNILGRHRSTHCWLPTSPFGSWSGSDLPIDSNDNKSDFPCTTHMKIKVGVQLMLGFGTTPVNPTLNEIPRTTIPRC